MTIRMIKEIGLNLVLPRHGHWCQMLNALKQGFKYRPILPCIHNNHITNTDNLILLIVLIYYQYF